jgi:hypothetical protein
LTVRPLGTPEPFNHEWGGLMKSKNQRLDEGVERNAYWRSLTPAAQLADLDRRLGVGVGANRQRAKLTAILEPNGITATNATPAVSGALPPAGEVTAATIKPKRGKKS